MGSCTAGTLSDLEATTWFCGNSNTTARAAGGKTANPWNLRDMHGNIQEWCWDGFFSSYPGSSTDYQGFVSATNRVVRGGSFDSYASACRSAARLSLSRTSNDPYIGMRLVRTIN